MKNTFFKQRSFYAVFLSVVLSVVLVAGAAGAVTTISTNINTGGTLTVSSQTTLTGNVDLGDAGGADNDIVNVYGTTTIIGAQAFIFGSSTAETMSGQLAGSVYFDSTNKVLRLFDGINWYPVASSTDAGGSLIIGGDTNLVRFNVVPSAYMALGTTSPQDNDYVVTTGTAILTIVATSTDVVPLRIFGASSTQTVSLFEIHNGSVELFAIDGYSGNASSTGSFSLGNYSTDPSILTVAGMATTTGSNGNIAMEGIFTVGVINGAITGSDVVASSTLTAQTISLAGTLNASSSIMTDGSLFVAGLATTTGTNGNIATQGTLTVGADVSGTAIDRIFGGICRIAVPGTDASMGEFVTVTASTTVYADCTSATGVTAGDYVFVSATSSLHAEISIQSASSSAANTIALTLFNRNFSSTTPSTADQGLTNPATAEDNARVQFWAFR